MKNNKITVYPAEEDGLSEELTIWYSPSELIREETRVQPEEWSSIDIQSIEDESGRKLTDSEINAFGLTNEEWVDMNEIYMGNDN